MSWSVSNDPKRIREPVDDPMGGRGGPVMGGFVMG